MFCKFTKVYKISTSCYEKVAIFTVSQFPSASNQNKILSMILHSSPTLIHADFWGSKIYLWASKKILVLICVFFFHSRAFLGKPSLCPDSTTTARLSLLLSDYVLCNTNHSCNEKTLCQSTCVQVLHATSWHLLTLSPVIDGALH